jgi:outer membrane biosynthesis protein TonB
MSKFLVKPRPKSGSAPHAGREAGKIPFIGKRAAVLAASAALLVGVGAAGQATESSIRVAATETQAAEAQSNLSIEKSEIRANPAPAPAAEEIAVAPQAAEPAPAAAPEPAPAPAPEAAPAPAPEPAPAPAAAPEPAPVVAVNDPAGAQAYAAGQLASYGWAPDQMQCLQTLWTKESDWTTTATNASSGAYGIVQSLPAEKMASAGPDYLTSYRTQINWGLNYIQERYQSPCGALNFHLSNNWY